MFQPGHTSIITAGAHAVDVPSFEGSPYPWRGSEGAAGRSYRCQCRLAAGGKWRNFNAAPGSTRGGGRDLGTSRRASMSVLGVSGRRRRARPERRARQDRAYTGAFRACGLLLAGASWGSTNRSHGKRESVIVRISPGGESKARLAVARLGGTTGRRLAIIDGFVAEVPASEARHPAGPALRAFRDREFGGPVVGRGLFRFGSGEGHGLDGEHREDDRCSDVLEGGLHGKASTLP